MLFTLQNQQLRICLTDYGARMVSVETPDRNGTSGHILLGFDDIASYEHAGGSFGAVLGRYANRIAGARFTLDGEAFQLAGNDGANILHGGAGGFGNLYWQVESFTEGEAPQLVLSLVSPDRDQGFPGILIARAVYRLEADSLQLDLSAITDAPTAVNLSSHPYFNLAGIGGHDILGHFITVDADYFLPTDAAQIPTGEIRPVAGGVFDFRRPQAFGQDIRSNDPQLLIARGYDHCFVLNKSPQPGPQFAARVSDPFSGRVLEIHTTQPGLQVYSGNMLDGRLSGRGGITFRQSSGFALEAQNFPDAPNHPNFPSSILRPAECYRQTIIYKFLTIDRPGHCGA
jgi:aldose 1-epimerase